MRKFLPLLFLICFQTVAEGSVLRINVETVIRNKIDQGLILTSEHHFSTKVLSGDNLSERLNENISVEFSLQRVLSLQDTYIIEGKLLYKGISLKNEFLLPKIEFSLQDRKSISLNLSDKKTVDLSFYLRKERF